MPMQYIFWGIMLFWLVCNFGARSEGWKDQAIIGGNLSLFVLLGCLGWKVFGPAVQG